MRAEVYPRVSEHIPEIIDLIEALVEREYTYEANGSVYFDVASFDDYGTLSNQELEDLEAQGDPDKLEEKRHPAISCSGRPVVCQKRLFTNTVSMNTVKSFRADRRGITLGGRTSWLAHPMLYNDAGVP